MQHGYIYKTTIDNPDSGLHKHFYIGQHRKPTLDCRYYGSGYKVRNYIKKYGTDSLTIEVLAWANNEDEINTLEAKYVDEHLNTDKCLNLVSGGKYRTWSLESRKKASMNMIGMKNHRYGKSHTEEFKKAASIRGRKFRHTAESIQSIRDTKRRNPFVYTDEIKKKMSDMAKITRNATGYKWTQEQIDSHRSRLILSTNKKRKIQNNDLPNIEIMLHNGVKQYEIAKIYNVSPHTISWAYRVRIPELKKIKPEMFK